MGCGEADRCSTHRRKAVEPQLSGLWFWGMGGSVWAESRKVHEEGGRPRGRSQDEPVCGVRCGLVSSGAWRSIHRRGRAGELTARSEVPVSPSTSPVSPPDPWPPLPLDVCCVGGGCGLEQEEE